MYRMVIQGSSFQFEQYKMKKIKNTQVQSNENFRVFCFVDLLLFLMVMMPLMQSNLLFSTEHFESNLDVDNMVLFFIFLVRHCLIWHLNKAFERLCVEI